MTLRISHAEAKALGIAGGPVAPRPPDDMNRTERRFRDEVLEPAWARGAIDDFRREPIKLRLAGRTWYTPDFLVQLPRGRWPAHVFVEIKGFMRDDAAVKVKVAADLYPCFGWVVVFRARCRGWRIHGVDSRGISRDPVPPPWGRGQGG